MSVHDSQTMSIEEQKRKIRERYKGVASDSIDVIPCIELVNFYEDTSRKRVAVYARVSTDSVNQTSSYELQKNYYEDLVARHPGWELVKIYADEGISGTSLNHRAECVRMLKDCDEGKIDLIVTKSVARFARNVVDCIGEVRKLAALPRPIGVFFEAEGIYTLNSDYEMHLSFVAAMAQEESHMKSRIMNSSIEMRFSRGIYLTPALLGYDVDEDGNLVINEDEAKTIRLCFFMYLYGYSTQQIADTLMKLGRLTKKGNSKWTASTVLGVLQNERHCGDVLAHKTWTPNYLDHKAKKNKMNRMQYRYKGHHEAIISRDDFIATQRLIANAKYGYKGLLPYLHVIDDGALRGFVEINTRWSGFKKEDYINAVRSIGIEDVDDPFVYRDKQVNPGDFDLRGYEIARAQFFQSTGNASVTFSRTELTFSKQCIRKLNNVTVVELLFDPVHHLLAVRSARKDNRHAVTWATVYERCCSQRAISGAAFLPTLYDILGWKLENKYRIRGVRRQKDEEVILLFDLHDTEVYIPFHHEGDVLSDSCEPFELFDQNTTPLAFGSKTKMLAYPADWVDSFGRDVYCHEQTPELAAIDRDGQWDISKAGTPYKSVVEVQPSSITDLQQGIVSILSTLKEATPNG